MIQEVSFKISKLLRLKGFDKEVNKRYNYYGLLSRYTQFPENYNTELYDKCYSAPTIFQTIGWLYEKHNIWICVSNVPFENHFTFEYSINNEEKCLHQYGTFESPEEAYESAIEYCLEQII